MLANWPFCALQCLACLLLIANSVLAHFVFLILCEWWEWRITKETWTWWTQTGYLPFLRQSYFTVCFLSTGSNRPWSARNNSANLAIKCQGEESRSEPFELFGPLIFFLPYCLFSGFFSWNTTCNALWQTAGSCSSYLLFQTGQKILVNPKSQILYHRLKFLNLVIFSPRH